MFDLVSSTYEPEQQLKLIQFALSEYRLLALSKVIYKAGISKQDGTNLCGAHKTLVHLPGYM